MSALKRILNIDTEGLREQKKKGFGNQGIDMFY